MIFANYVILRLVHNVQNVQSNAQMEFLIAKQLARLAKTNAAYWLPDTLMELLIGSPESQLNLFRKWNTNSQFLSNSKWVFQILFIFWYLYIRCQSPKYENEF